MKNGLTHWVSEDVWNKAQNALQNQTSHTFIKIIEMNITINTAEISGVYTIEQYNDIIKIKQGMWQCEYKKWHNRKDTCECAKEYAKIKREKEQRRMEEEYEKQTPEQKERVQKEMDKIRAEMKRIGIRSNIKKV